jgi:hypothetical protein
MVGGRRVACFASLLVVENRDRNSPERCREMHQSPRLTMTDVIRFFATSDTHRTYKKTRDQGEYSKQTKRRLQRPSFYMRQC